MYIFYCLLFTITLILFHHKRIKKKFIELLNHRNISFIKKKKKYGKRHGRNIG